MGITVSARDFSRYLGHYLYQARRQVLALTYHGGVAGYVVSPEAYALILQGHRLREEGHRQAVARMGATDAADIGARSTSG